MTCTCACHEAEEHHDMKDCYCMDDKQRESFERFIDENENVIECVECGNFYAQCICSIEDELRQTDEDRTQ